VVVCLMGQRGIASCLSKLSRDRLPGLHRELVRVVERAIQITLGLPGAGRPAHA
jgi:hypothetical protein